MRERSSPVSTIEASSLVHALVQAPDNPFFLGRYHEAKNFRSGLFLLMTINKSTT
jgi:hypothetical protein